MLTYPSQFVILIQGHKAKFFKLLTALWVLEMSTFLRIFSSSRLLQKPYLGDPLVECTWSQQKAMELVLVANWKAG